MRSGIDIVELKHYVQHELNKPQTSRWCSNLMVAEQVLEWVLGQSDKLSLIKKEQKAEK